MAGEYLSLMRLARIIDHFFTFGDARYFNPRLRGRGARDRRRGSRC